MVRRVESGNVHAHYMLAIPVHRGDDARVKPLQALARLRVPGAAAPGRRGYNGVPTLNPAWQGPEFEDSLAERVARIEGTMSASWRLPTNVALAPSPPPEATA